MAATDSKVRASFSLGASFIDRYLTLFPRYLSSRIQCFISFALQFDVSLRVYSCIHSPFMIDDRDDRITSLSIFMNEMMSLAPPPYSLSFSFITCLLPFTADGKGFQ